MTQNVNYMLTQKAYIGYNNDSLKDMYKILKLNIQSQFNKIMLYGVIEKYMPKEFKVDDILTVLQSSNYFTAKKIAKQQEEYENPLVYLPKTFYRIVGDKIKIRVDTRIGDKNYVELDYITNKHKKKMNIKNVYLSRDRVHFELEQEINVDIDKHGRSTSLDERI